jgi:hypothetical protein
VAVTILAVMTLAIARITTQTNDAIAANTRQSVENANARAALDMIARDFSQALADGRIRFQWVQSDTSTYGNPPLGCDRLHFAAYRHVIPGNAGANEDREAVAIAYHVKEVVSGSSVYSLLRREEPIAWNGYIAGVNPCTSFDASDPEVIRNVVEFRTDCRDTNGAAVTSGSFQQRLPVYIDVYLSILTDSEVRRAKDLGTRFGPGSQEQMDFIVKNAKRYHTRCFSLNRMAYENGR